jgi:transcriptional regulator with XRE-family HTH domain
MTKNQLNRAMVSMGITQIALANALGATDRNVRRWMTGQSPVPVSVAKLLNLMADTNTKLEDLRS